MRQLDPIIAEAGQVDFKIPGGYAPGLLIVTVNGVIIAPNDFHATDGATVTLAAGIGEGDEIGAILFE